ncbi:MAG: hypothetical protein Fur0043_07640 [Anaerolineales bacterium]
MSKKKINKRLDKLFDEIKTDEAGAQAEHPEQGGKKERETPSPPVLSEVSDTLAGIGKTLRATPKPATVEAVSASAVTLSTAFRVDERTWSTIKVIDETGSRAWGSEEQLLVKQIADQLSLAMENARLFRETRARAEELSALNQIILTSSQTLQLDQLLDTLLEQILQLLGFRSGVISLQDETSGKLELAVHRNLPAPLLTTIQTVGLKDTLCGYVFQTQLPLALADIRAGAPVDVAGLIANGLVAYAGVPLEIRGQAIGTLCVFNDAPTAIPDRILQLTYTIGRQIGVAIENARLFQRTQQSEAELRALFAAMEDVIIVYDRQGRYVRIAETNPNYLFRPSQEMLGRTIQEILPEPLHQPFLSTIQAVLDTGQPQKIEYPLTIQGQEYWFDASVSKLTDEHVFWVARDITERKKAEEDLAKFKLGIENTDNIVFLTDTNGVIQYTNQGFEKIYGYTAEEVIGQTPRILTSGLQPQEKYQELWETLLDQKTYTVEITNRAKDGHLVPVRGTYSPIIGANGTMLGFLVVQTDMTERKRNEEALRRRNEYLAASAEIGRLVLSSLELKSIFSRAVNLIKERFGYYHAAIFIVEETGFNAVLEEATGEAGEQMKQHQHSLPVGSKSTVGQAIETGVAVVINNTALDPIHKPNPLLPDTKAEVAIPLHIGSRIIGALDIQATEVNAFSEDDIAILQLLADQIAIGIDNARSYTIAQQAVQEMREVDRLKSQFLANMSHELRTPLNSIIGFARVILKGIDGPTTELQQQDLTAIFNAGQHLLGLINDILDLSRIEAGKMELTFGEVNINDLITSVMATAAGLVKDKPITLKQEVAPNLPTIRADPMRIRQVLINLLSNAAKFTEKGEIIVRAELDKSTSAEQNFVLVSVTDTGPGISPEDQAKLFQPFSQVDASLTRKAGGSGLGLSICHHLIQMHQGRIGVHSALGKGSTFYFAVPVFAQEQKPASRAAKTILAVDDDPQVLKLYERYLQPKGFQVVSVNKPDSTKAKVKQLKPFAIILDIMMPGYDGWRVLEDLKSDAETRSVPIIICSILDEEEKGFSLGAADYLVKPIAEEDLLSALDRLNNDGSIREVLIIDDDPNDLRLIGAMIANQGRYKPILAEGGQAGWEIIQTKTPHAIVLDLFMPEVDGFTILERIHASKDLRNIPVVVVSSSDLTEEQKKQLQGFGQRLLQKSSLEERELIATIENALKRIGK